MNEQQTPKKKYFTKSNLLAAGGFILGLATVTLIYAKADNLNAQSESIREGIEANKRWYERDAKLNQAQQNYYDTLELKELERMEAQELAEHGIEATKPAVTS